MTKIYKLLDKIWVRALLLIPPYLIISGIMMDVWVNVSIKNIYPYNPDYQAVNIVLISGFFICFSGIAIYIADNKNLKHLK